MYLCHVHRYADEDRPCDECESDMPEKTGPCANAFRERTYQEALASWGPSARREECAQSIYRYAQRLPQSAPLRWAEVDPQVRERYRQSADLALAVADDTLSPALGYVGLMEWFRQRGDHFDSPELNANPGRRWALAGMFRTAVHAMRRAAAGLTPETYLEAKTYAARDRCQALVPASELTNRTLTPRSKRVLVDLEGREIEP